MERLADPEVEAREARAALAQVHDPRSRAVDLEGIRRGRAGRSGASRPSLAQIDAPPASRALASLAVRA